MKRTPHLMLWVCLAWTAIIGLDLSAGYFNALLLDTHYEVLREIPFTARWIAWIPLTPLALYTGYKMTYHQNKAIDFWFFHLSIYVLLFALHVFTASAIAFALKALLQQPADYVVILKKCALTGVFYDGIIYCFMLLLINVVEHYRALQAEKLRSLSLEKMVSETRLQFLKQQLQPHFLFNTHHSIITLIKMGEKEKAASMLDKLSGLMRVALREVDNQKVTIGNEIETLQMYIDIQKTRFGEKLQVEFHIAETLTNALVPGLILQPLVENAIKYAIEPATGQGNITVTAVEVSGALVLSVKDDTNRKPSAGNITFGVGLSNTAERIANLYGDKGSVDIAPYQEGDRSGMIVTIQLPIEYAAH